MHVANTDSPRSYTVVNLLTNNLAVGTRTTITDAHEWLGQQDRYRYVCGQVDSEGKLPGIVLRTRKRPDQNDFQGRLLLSAAVEVMLRNTDGIPDFQDDKLRIVHAVDPDNPAVTVGSLHDATQGYVDNESLRRQARNPYARQWEDNEDFLCARIGRASYRIIRTVLANLPPHFDEITDKPEIKHHIGNAIAVLSGQVENNQLQIALIKCLHGMPPIEPLQPSPKMRKVLEMTGILLIARGAPGANRIDGAVPRAEVGEHNGEPIQPPEPPFEFNGDNKSLESSPKLAPAHFEVVAGTNASATLAEPVEATRSTVLRDIEKNAHERAKKHLAQRKKNGFGRRKVKSMEPPLTRTHDTDAGATGQAEKTQRQKRHTASKPEAEVAPVTAPVLHRSEKSSEEPGGDSKTDAARGHDDRRSADNEEDATRGRTHDKRRRGKLGKIFRKKSDDTRAKDKIEASQKRLRPLTHSDMLARVPNHIWSSIPNEHRNLLFTLFSTMTTLQKLGADSAGEDDEARVRETLIGKVIDDSLKIFTVDQLSSLSTATTALRKLLPQPDAELGGEFIGLFSTLRTIEAVLNQPLHPQDGLSSAEDNSEKH